MQKPSIPKGTRDFSPDQLIRRNYIFDIIKSKFKKFGDTDEIYIAAKTNKEEICSLKLETKTNNISFQCSNNQMFGRFGNFSISIFNNDYTFVEGQRTWNGGTWTN